LAGVDDIYIRSVAGRNEDTLLLHATETKKVCDWSTDGRYLVFTSWNPRSNLDLWLLPTFGNRKPIPFLQSPFNEKQGQVSPDGRWMAYASDESGRWEVYVQSFPMPGAKRAVSIGGGDQPRWRRDGSELFYLSADHMLMAVDVRRGERWKAGTPRRLFQVRLSQMSANFLGHYAVTADGQRFLVDAVDERESAESMTVLVNWTAAVNH
jgi:dipeptidyl aminopeptidase/acylaminoacyl peptidase